MEKRIIGIQQIGIGVKNMREAWSWYKKAFGMDIRVFEDDAVAALMLPYTGRYSSRSQAVHCLPLFNTRSTATEILL